MPTKDRDAQSESDMSIVDAVETLSNLADLDFEAEVGVSQAHELVIADKKISYRTVHWIATGDTGETVKVVRDTFRTILSYLRNFYKRQRGKQPDKKSAEGIQDIMVLVGEAAKKLDRYTSLFKKSRIGSVTRLREFKQLERFYQNKVLGKGDPESTEGIMAIASAGNIDETIDVEKDVALDLDQVKKDEHYELMMLRSPRGRHYYPAHLIRNMKLVTDFGENYGVSAADDPLVRTPIWLDATVQKTAEHILGGVGNVLDLYVDAIRDQRLTELSSLLNKAVMAIFLAANPRNLLRNSPVKSCSEYFGDFQHYLRRALTSREYRKKLAYQGRKMDHLDRCMIRLCHMFCRALYMRSQGHLEALPVLDKLLKAEAREQGIKNFAKMPLLEQIQTSHDLMDALFERHPNGPVRKFLEAMEKQKEGGFDPLMQENSPHQWLDLYMEDHRIRLTHMASPTAQIYVDRCDVVPEFKAFIQSCKRGHFKRKHLIFNLQDRTSWLEHPRCECLEKFADQTEYSKHLDVVSLTKETYFYHQNDVYHDEEDSAAFTQHLLEQLRGDSTGFHFTPYLRRYVLGNFADRLVEAVHETFFGDKDLLSRDERHAFIEIVYLFIQLKVLDLVSPDSFSFSCKDGLDIGCCAAAEFYAFVQLINNRRWSKEDVDMLFFMFQGPSLYLRERAVLPERFNRSMNALRLMQGVIDEKGFRTFARELKKKFQPLYKTAVLGMNAEPPSLRPLEPKES